MTAEALKARADAWIAANAARQHIDPKARLFPGHSSELRL